MAAVLSPPQRTRPVHPRPSGRGRPALRLVRDDDAPRRATAAWPASVAPMPVSTARPAARAATFRRRRVVALVLLIGLTLTLQSTATSLMRAVWADQAVTTAPASPAVAPIAGGAPAAGAREYVVRPGDSLWTIAERLQPEGDVRPLVDALSERAGSPSLQVGQRIDLDGLGL